MAFSLSMLKELPPDNIPVEKADKDIFLKIRNRKYILVKNKIDLTPAEKFINEMSWHIKQQVSISALNFHGIDELETAIAECVFHNGAFDFADCRVAPNFRHKVLIENSIDALQRAVDGFQTMMAPELLAIDIKETVRYLEEILGIHVTSDVLDEIFSRFCIGK